MASRLYGDGEGVLIVKGQQVPIDDAVASALQALGGGRRAARVRVIRSGLSVRGDTLRVRQVVQLMLSHVLRTGGGEVLVKAEPIGSERIGVVVSHPGPPVPAPEREEMFEPFTADGSDPFRPGRLNVGLWAARRLALLMGGELGYDHRDGYSRFELTLPAASTRRETA